MINLPNNNLAVFFAVGTPKAIERKLMAAFKITKYPYREGVGHSLGVNTG